VKHLDIAAPVPYQIHVGRDFLRQSGALIAEKKAPCRVVVVSDHNTHRYYSWQVRDSLTEAGFTVLDWQVPMGEGKKELAPVCELLEAMAREGFGRGDLVVGVGGGVVLDIAGVAAGTYMRGIDYIQIPTTPQAAVTSTLSGECSVNLRLQRDGMGVRLWPRMVLCDVGTFDSLLPDVYATGWPDVVRCAFVAGGKVWEMIQQPDFDAEELFAGCIEHKARLAFEDSLIYGTKRWMDLGGTVARAIRQVTGYLVPHHRALALGMLVTARVTYANALGGDGTLDSQLLAVLQRYKMDFNCEYTAAQITRGAKADPYLDQGSGTLLIVLPTGVGKCRLMPININNMERILSVYMKK